MSFKDFKIVETIGKGSFASVFKVIRRSDNKVYALKRVKISKMSKKEIADALNEIRFLASIRHKNIVGFLEAFLENNESELCIVMEFCGCGDLAQKVERYKRKRQYIEEKVIWRYLIQALKALNHLHEKGICHRDLKVANTFLAEDGSIKIGDMNVSKRLKKGQLQTQIGTPYYMSPEIWNNKPYDNRSDIWSLGCMIYELAALRPPFLGDSFPSLKRAVTLGRYAALPAKYSDGSLSRVLALMLKLDARERPSADALLKCADVASRLQFDETSTHFGGAGVQDGNMPHLRGGGQQNQHQQALALINTIKVPQQLKKLNSALPKPCYPDVRPNSPTSWTVTEQRQQAASQRKPPPLPPVPSLVSISSSDKENHLQLPLASNRSSGADSNAGDCCHSSRSSSNYSAAPPYTKYVPVPPPSTQGSAASSNSNNNNNSCYDENLNRRRPLAPMTAAASAAVAGSNNNIRSNAAAAQYHRYNHSSVSSDYNNIGKQHVPYQPSLDPIPSNSQVDYTPAPPSNSAMPSAAAAFHRHKQYDQPQHHSQQQQQQQQGQQRIVAAPPAAAAPGNAASRLQYHHHHHPSHRIF